MVWQERKAGDAETVQSAPQVKAPAQPVDKSARLAQLRAAVKPTKKAPQVTTEPVTKPLTDAMKQSRVFVDIQTAIASLQIDPAQFTWVLGESLSLQDKQITLPVEPANLSIGHKRELWNLLGKYAAEKQ